MKVAINKQHGGFGLSDKAFEKLLQLRGIEFENEESKFGHTNYYVKGHVGDDDYFISQYEHYSPYEKMTEEAFRKIVDELTA